VKAFQQALNSSQNILESTKLDALNANQTRRDLYRAKYNYLLSRLHLKATLGTLSEKDLNVVNKAFHDHV
jgi:outer membrane protein